MSSTAVLGFIKDIVAGNVKAVHDRLNSKPQPISPNASFADPKEQGLSYRLLHKAVEVGSRAIIEALLAAGADVNAADSRGRTPLHWCCADKGAGALSIAELLLQQPGINIHAAGSTKATPLHEAAAAGNIALLQLLLKHGADPQDTTSGFSALHAACMGSCAAPGPAQKAAPASQQPTGQQQETQPPQKQPLKQPVDAAPSKVGQPKPPGAAAGKLQAQQQKPAPRPAVVPSAAKKAGAAAAAPQRPSIGAAARASVGRTSAAAPTASKVAAASGCSGAAAQAPTGPAAAAGESMGAKLANVPHAACSISQELLDLLLQGDGQHLLSCQDSEGLTPVMRLVQQGHRAEAEMLLARGDCNLHAQAASTGDTALHIACSSACPGMQLVSALVAAGADPLLARSSDGSTPLLLAAKAGGQVGLELAKALLQGGSNSSSLQAERRQQQQQASDTQATGTLWCRMDVDSEPLSQTSSSSSSGLDAANAAGETAVGVAAAAVLASVNISGGQAGSAQGPVAGSRAAASSAAQQELLMLLLDQRPSVPQQLSSALLQQGLSRNLPDSLTAKVVACMANMSALEAAAGAAAGTQRLEFNGLLEAKMYRTAIALLSKSSGRRPCEDVEAGGNTLLHTAVAGSEDLPEYVAALVEAGVPVNAANKEHDTALHLAARQGHLEACRALVAAGADLLRRNGKNRIPGAQLKLCEPVKAYLQQAEEEFRAQKEEQRHTLWDDKMRATQTQSAFGIRVT